MFEWLFNYPWRRFAAGTVELAVSWPVAAGILGLLAVGAWWGLRYAKLASGRARIVLFCVRLSLVAVVLVALLDPHLVTPALDARSGSVAVLIDDSLSMGAAGSDGGDGSAGAQAWAMFAPGIGSVSRDLEERFQVHYVKVGAGAQQLHQRPGFDAPHTHLAAGLRSVERLSQPVAAIWISDGGGVLDEAAREAMLGLRSAGVPVHTVTVGHAVEGPDVAVTALHVPPRAMAGDSVVVTAKVRVSGVAEVPVTVALEDNGLLLEERTVKADGGAGTLDMRFQLTPQKAGPHRLKLSVSSVPGERMVKNNAQTRLLHVQQRHLRVLHFESEPRFEVKFARRALSTDRYIALTSLVRTAENKFYRLGVRSADELRDGFPREPEVLFEYDLVVVGSVAASDLDQRQHEALMQFVVRRGGSLLMLGGNRSLANGGWQRTRLGRALPVILPATTSRERYRVMVRPVRLAREHGVAALAYGTPLSKPFDQLPALSVVNGLTGLKPGAALYWQGRTENGVDLILLAHHRFGRGNIAVLPARDLWRWQMHSSVALDDQSHELLWQRMSRWLGAAAPQRLELHLSPARAAVGQAVILEARLVDHAYVPVEGAQLMLTSNARARGWEQTGAGVYRQVLVPVAEGADEITVAFDEGDERVISTTYLHVAAQGREFEGETPNIAAMGAIAQAGGGSAFTGATAAHLPQVLAAVQRESSQEIRLPLWDAWGLLLLVVFMASIEWFVRKRLALA